MKIKSIFKTLALMAAMAVTVSLTSCSDDEPESADDGTVATSCTYTLTITVPDKAKSDQHSYMKTVVDLSDSQGERYTKNISLANSTEFTPAWTITVPANNYFTITQTLKDGVDLSAKETYCTGIHYKLTVTSLNENGDIVDTKFIDDETTIELDAEGMTELYPLTTTLGYSVNEKGVVTIY